MPYRLRFTRPGRFPCVDKTQAAATASTGFPECFILMNYIYSNKGLLGLVGWLVVLGLTALGDNISVYIEPSPKEREKEEKG